MKSRSELIAIAPLLVLAGAVALAACGSGDIAATSLPQATPPAGPVQTVASTPTPDDCVQPACQDFPLPKTPHAVRLTSPQWERTIKDLLKLDALPGNSVDFPSDPVPSRRPLRRRGRRSDRHDPALGRVPEGRRGARRARHRRRRGARQAPPRGRQVGRHRRPRLGLRVGLPAACLPAPRHAEGDRGRRRRRRGRRCERERRRPVPRAREVDPHGDPPVAEASLSHQPRRGGREGRTRAPDAARDRDEALVRPLGHDAGRRAHREGQRRRAEHEGGRRHRRPRDAQRPARHRRDARVSRPALSRRALPRREEPAARPAPGASTTR